MATPTLAQGSLQQGAGLSSTFGRKPGVLTVVIFFAILGLGLLYTGFSLKQDMDELGTVVLTWTPFILLGVALVIALAVKSPSIVALFTRVHVAP